MYEIDVFTDMRDISLQDKEIIEKLKEAASSFIKNNRDILLSALEDAPPIIDHYKNDQVFLISGQSIASALCKQVNSFFPQIYKDLDVFTLNKYVNFEDYQFQKMGRDYYPHIGEYTVSDTYEVKNILIKTDHMNTKMLKCQYIMIKENIISHFSESKHKYLKFINGFDITTVKIGLVVDRLMKKITLLVHSDLIKSLKLAVPVAEITEYNLHTYLRLFEKNIEILNQRSFFSAKITVKKEVVNAVIEVLENELDNFLFAQYWSDNLNRSKQKLFALSLKYMDKFTKKMHIIEESLLNITKHTDGSSLEAKIKKLFEIFEKFQKYLRIDTKNVYLTACGYQPHFESLLFTKHSKIINYGHYEYSQFAINVYKYEKKIQNTKKYDEFISQIHKLVPLLNHRYITPEILPHVIAVFDQFSEKFDPRTLAVLFMLMDNIAAISDILAHAAYNIQMAIQQFLLDVSESDIKSLYQNFSFLSSEFTELEFQSLLIKAFSVVYEYFYYENTQNRKDMINEILKIHFNFIKYINRKINSIIEKIADEVYDIKICRFVPFLFFNIIQKTKTTPISPDLTHLLACGLSDAVSEVISILTFEDLLKNKGFVLYDASHQLLLTFNPRDKNNKLKIYGGNKQFSLQDIATLKKISENLFKAFKLKLVTFGDIKKEIK